MPSLNEFSLIIFGSEDNIKHERTQENGNRGEHEYGLSDYQIIGLSDYRIM